MKFLFWVIIAVSILCYPLKGEIILSEILANEPNGSASLEWLEIYNNSSNHIDLGNYILVDGDNAISFPEEAIDSAYSYLVVCRRLYSTDGGVCFENYWGNSSGVWGDAVYENYVVIEAGISLRNSCDTLCLLNADSVIIDQYIWHEPSDDGRSIERNDVSDELSAWHPCYDPSGSTPGRENSACPSDNHDYILEAAPRLISLSGINKFITISYSAPVDSKINLAVYDDSARKLKTLLNNSDNTYGTIIWNMTGDNNYPLAPGLYIISFKITDAINAYENIPIAIAP
ncbi:MAG: lamin tail domain-containing protein [candidate division Zixibacteria bacterium]|nr:lamin tail domain-containing protein [candidate division Zixibacteria bacterium]